MNGPALHGFSENAGASLAAAVQIFCADVITPHLRCFRRRSPRLLKPVSSQQIGWPYQVFGLSKMVGRLRIDDAGGSLPPKSSRTENTPPVTTTAVADSFPLTVAPLIYVFSELPRAGKNIDALLPWNVGESDLERVLLPPALPSSSAGERITSDVVKAWLADRSRTVAALACFGNLVPVPKIRDVRGQLALKRSDKQSRKKISGSRFF